MQQNSYYSKGHRTLCLSEVNFWWETSSFDEVIKHILRLAPSIKIHFTSYCYNHRLYYKATSSQSVASFIPFRTKHIFVLPPINCHAVFVCSLINLAFSKLNVYKFLIKLLKQRKFHSMYYLLIHTTWIFDINFYWQLYSSITKSSQIMHLYNSIDNQCILILKASETKMYYM